MAYGGGFLGGLSEFAGGVAQGIERAKKLKMEEEEAARDAERFGRERKTWEREDKLSYLLDNAPKVGDPIGARTNPLFSGQSEEEAQNFISGYAPQPAPMEAAPAPQVGLPAPVAAPAVPTPAPVVSPAELPPVAKGATFEEAFAPLEKGAMPAAQAQPAPVETPQPKGPPKLTTYFDPFRKTYNVVSEDDVRRATEADVASYEVAAYRAAGDVKTARALQRDALEMINLRSDVNRKRALDVMDKAMLSGNPEQGMSEALRVLNSDDSITLGANFAMIKTKDGKYTLGAAPDGTNLEPRPLPSNIFGTYDSPDKLFQAVRSVVEGKFTEFQNVVFNQQVSLQELGLRERAQRLDEDQFAFTKFDANRKFGLAASEARRRASSGGGPTKADVKRATAVTDKARDYASKNYEVGTPEYNNAYRNYIVQVLNSEPDSVGAIILANNPGLVASPAAPKTGARPQPAPAPAARPAAKPAGFAPPKTYNQNEIAGLVRTAQGAVSARQKLDDRNTGFIRLINASGTARGAVNRAIDAASKSGLPQYQRKPNERPSDYRKRVAGTLGLPSDY